MMISNSSPIVAIATPSGRGGVGVIRISGKDLTPLFQPLFGKTALQARHANYLPFKNTDGSSIDQGLAIYFKTRISYTGEDVRGLKGHGGPGVWQMLLTRCIEAGRDIELRLAEPGEFTRRAFMNDKLDLAQAEAVADLIDASTETAAKSASRSLSGVFSKSIHELVAQITHLRMLVEATLDFPEEAIDFFKKTDANKLLTNIETALLEIFSQAAQGALLREGLNVVLAGPPNVGKSSLLNALAGAEVAIVTPIAGTTRDVIAELAEWTGRTFSLVDTGGMFGATSDPLHALVAEKGRKAIESADLVIIVVERQEPPLRTVGTSYPRLLAHAAHPLVRARGRVA